jgi:ketosteroid isomerase-like protein
LLAHEGEGRVRVGAEGIAVEVVRAAGRLHAAMLVGVISDETMDAAAARELIERYNAAWNAQDLGTIDELHHPGIVFHNHTAEERADGAAAVREHIARIFDNNPTLRFTARSLYVADDFAVCEWTASTGSKEWDGVDVFPFRDGKIARKDVYSSSHRPREL